MFPFSDLSEDALCQIFPFFDYYDTSNVALACHHFLSLACKALYEVRLYKAKDEESAILLLRNLSSKCFGIRSVHMPFIPSGKVRYRNILENVPRQVTKLSFQSNLITDAELDLTPFTSLQSLSLCGCASIKNLSSLPTTLRELDLST